MTWPPHDLFNNTRVGGGRHLWATNIDPTQTNKWQPNQSRGIVRRKDLAPVDTVYSHTPPHNWHL